MPQLAHYDDCTGCMACNNACNHQAIGVVKDKAGFLHPVVIKENCVECNLCEKACPIVTPLEPMNAFPSSYAVWHEKDRTVSSSGGAFSAFARMVLAQGGVVVGAAFDKDLHLRHVIIDKVDELHVLRGSKYVQSEIGNTFKAIKEYLLEGQKVLFCGTPCQVAGLRGFIRKNYDHLLTADLICHGVPSDSVFQSYLIKLKNRLGKKDEVVANYEFRRRKGWTLNPSVTTTSYCGPLFEVDALYLDAFDKGAIFRESCYHCPFAQIPRTGDVTLGDFWGIGRHGKKFKHNVTKGVSLLLVNSEKGKIALSTLGKDVFMEQRSVEEAIIENHNLIGSSVRHVLRDEIIEAFMNEQMNLDEIERRFHLVNHSLKGQIKMWTIKLGLYDNVNVLYNWYKSL